jgi:putative spermidine/putrescine transport system permease protein
LTSTESVAAPPARTLRRRGAALAYAHPKLRLGALLSAPLLWIGVLYLGSLSIMLASAFWTTNDFTGAVVHTFTTSNFHDLFHQAVYRTVAIRTFVVAVLVTVIDAALALPLAFFAAKVVQRRGARYALVVAVSMPLWASYLVKGYAWRVMLTPGGVLDWALKPLGLQGPGLGLPATVIALSYIWFPYMVLPIYASLERLPQSLLDASADLGAQAGRTFRSVVWPLIVPGIVAGSIFTFSLTLGDYIMVTIVGGKTQLFANIVYSSFQTADNLPFAAAASVFPIAVVVLYLVAVRRTGALDNL